MKTQFPKINIFIVLAAIFLLGIFVLPSAAKAWTVDWHYPQYNSSSVSVNINASAQYVSPGGYVTLSWTSQNVSACTKTGSWYGSIPTSGSETVVVNQNSEYGITCTNNSGGTSYDSVWVYTNNSSSGQSSSSSNSTYNSGIYNPNLNLNVKSRDAISSSSFAKEISSQPGRVIDFQVNINNDSANKIGYMFVTLPSRLSYIDGSAYLDGVKLNISSVSSIDLNYLSASSQHSLIFQASIAPYNSFSESTTVLSANVSAKSANGSAYIASDYTNILVYKNGNGSGGIVLGASTVNTGTGALSTILISALVGLLAVLSYLLVKFYKSAKKESIKETGCDFKTSISEKIHSLAQKIRSFAKKIFLKTLEIYDL